MLTPEQPLHAHPQVPLTLRAGSGALGSRDYEYLQRILRRK